MIAIFGAGGSIGDELLPLLLKSGQRVRLVSRKLQPVPSEQAASLETFAADLSNEQQCIQAATGCDLIYVLVGLKYDIAVWRELWPKIMHNIIEAAKRTGARLIFFDNVYMYGKVNGPMTEETPFRPSSKKGEVRAKIATELIDAWKSGSITAMIARAADFYGPGAQNSVMNRVVFDNFAKRKSAMWIGKDTVPHSYTFTPDAAQALVTLADSTNSWNQTWHMPTAVNPQTGTAPTGKQWVEMIAREFGVAPKYRVLGRTMVWIAGLFDSDIGESVEMMYQNDSPYIFDSSKFESAFRVKPTTPADGVRITAASYRP